jgi:hypothetical protein
MTKTSKQSKSSTTAEPLLGIFWLLDGSLITDCAPLSEAEAYGDHLTHSRGHVDVWEQWQRTGMVPADVPYEEPPRGRVMFNRNTNEFVLLADRCVLKNTRAVIEIKTLFHLPNKVTVDTDPHYRCNVCLYGKFEEEDDEL